MQSAFQTALKNNFDEAFSIIYNKNINLKQNLFGDKTPKQAKELLKKWIDRKDKELFKILKMTE